MTCPVCGAETKVVDSRSIEDGTRRRRKCLECDYRFSTVEIDVDYYEALKPINKGEFQKALLDGYAELTKRLYKALGFGEGGSTNG